MSIIVAIMAKISYIVTGSLACLILQQTIATKGDSFLRRGSHDEGLAVSDADVRNEYQMIDEVPSSTDFKSTSGAMDSKSSNYTPAALSDQVTELPGLTFEPSFNQFSGYLDVAPTRQIHYWYIESMNNPSTDPVVFWTNGGPGCSGLVCSNVISRFDKFNPLFLETSSNLSLLLTKIVTPKVRIRN